MPRTRTWRGASSRSWMSSTIATSSWSSPPPRRPRSYTAASASARCLRAPRAASRRCRTRNTWRASTGPDSVLIRPWPRHGPRRPSDDPALDLVALDGFEQRAEVAFAEALVSLALNDLEEDRPNDVACEDL